MRGDYEKNDNEDVILPFTLLRRQDCVLEENREKVRQTETRVAGKVTADVLKKLLIGAAGVPFYNRSKFSFAEVLKDPANIKETYAICKADALMKGDDGSRIKQGNSLSEDKLGGHQFNFTMANPEFGTDWKKIQDFVRREAGRGDDGRFGAGLPDVGDASLLSFSI